MMHVNKGVFGYKIGATRYKLSEDYPEHRQGNHHLISEDYPRPNMVRITPSQI